MCGREEARGQEVESRVLRIDSWLRLRLPAAVVGPMLLLRCLLSATGCRAQMLHTLPFIFLYCWLSALKLRFSFTSQSQWKGCPKHIDTFVECTVLPISIWCCPIAFSQWHLCPRQRLDTSFAAKAADPRAPLPRFVHHVLHYWVAALCHLI